MQPDNFFPERAFSLLAGNFAFIPQALESSQKIIPNFLSFSHMVGASG